MIEFHCQKVGRSLLLRVSNLETPSNLTDYNTIEWSQTHDLKQGAVADRGVTPTAWVS